MGVLSGLEPKEVFHFFEEICRIPHGSGNTEKISNYLKAFAEERGLFCIQDEWHNVIIVKEATPGYEEEETMILQGHIDMVAVKEAQSTIDMRKEALRLQTDGKKVYAEETSLGGDDGIAVAYALALLDAKEIKHPRLEVILTSDEETGMEGARKIDLSMLRGKKMLNLDQEEEGVLLTSCAGGARADVKIPVEWEENPFRNQDTEWLRLRVKGLQGGHSGTEIVRGGGNANCLMGRILYDLLEQIPVGLATLHGGVADNAIPREAQADILAARCDVEKIKDIVQKAEKEIQNELLSKDPSFQAELSINAEGGGTGRVLTAESAKRAVACLLAMPNGVQAMSADVDGLVETSLNLGIMSLSDTGLLLEYALRSSLDSAKRALYHKIRAVAQLVGASVSVRGEYPGWAYRKDSPLREKMIRIYEEMYSEKPRIQAIHAGLECGILADKIPGLDCVAIGPDMADVHTTEESIDVASVQRVWRYLIKVLEDKN